MEDIIGYAVKAVVCSGAFYLLYRLLLDQKTGYAFCRVYLVTALAVSALIPALRFAVWPGEVIEIPLELLAMMGDSPSAATASTPVVVPEPALPRPESYLLLFYGAVSLFFAIAIAAQFVRIRHFRRKSVRIKLEGAAVYESSEVKTPFTFFRSVFIPSGLPAAEREQIITHEISHARHNHSAELLAMEVMKALMWFNPFLWLSRKALVEVHEYEADNAVIEKGHDVHDYKNLLFRQLFGYSPDISNGLAASKTKKRFIMIDKKKPGRRSVLRAAAVLPVLTALVMLFSFTNKAASIVYITGEPTVAVQQPETPFEAIVPDNSGTGNKENITYSIRQGIEWHAGEGMTPEEFAEKWGGTAEEMTHSFRVRFHEKHGMTPEEYERIFLERFYEKTGKTPEEFMESFDHKFYEAFGKLPQEFFNSINDDLEKRFSALSEEFAELRSRSRYTDPMDMLREEYMKDLNPEKSSVFLEEYGMSLSEFHEKLGKIASGRLGNVTREELGNGIGQDGKKIAVFLDGTEINMEEFGILRLTGSSSLTIISDKETLESYGKGDYDHIFLITNERPAAGPSLNAGADNIFSGTDNPALYIDGVESDKSFSDIDPDQIAHITVLKDGAALEEYGKPSVINITTKAAAEEDDEEPYIVVENMPQFDGSADLSKFRKWINEALINDDNFGNHTLNGRYIISFIINKEGKLTKATVVRSADTSYDEDMIRIFESSPLWTPGTQRGHKVNVKLTLPFEFIAM